MKKRKGSDYDFCQCGVAIERVEQRMGNRKEGRGEGGREREGNTVDGGKEGGSVEGKESNHGTCKAKS